MGIDKPLQGKIVTSTDSVKRLDLYAETNLPTRHGLFRCIVFRDSKGLEHVAMVQGNIEGQSRVLCRVHSECLTSEVFGSLKCDCKEQLDSALDLIHTQGRGLVLYLRQEGRGIGLGNKVRAYALQEKGFDTVDANEVLGLPVDARDFGIAAAMLHQLGVESIELLTSNPLKIRALETAGVVVFRKKLDTPSISNEARAYVSVKQKRLGHLK
ncbi:MAG: GTP cyclohydrolase II [Myxococcaceae bacterium]|nr:GTP cyclohydrolase II [Myxococcaceae bacterium]MBH2006311.1 GTP cyclohydrolase II [Myxococcaceae bacterium]